MKERCEHDLTLFAKYYFPSLTRLPYNALHRYLFLRREEKTTLRPPERRGSIDVALAPRGAAKSTLTSLIFPIHAMLYRTEFYILLISATQHQALTRLANIRRTIGLEERLMEAFSKELGQTERNSEATLVINEVRIDAYSAGSELRGQSHGAWRPTWVVLDDVESSTRVLQANYRAKLYDWMTEVIENLGNGYTHIDLIGTLLHPRALPARLAERPDVQSKIFRAILAEADSKDLWESWRQRVFDLSHPKRLANAREFFDANREAMLDGASVLWPEKESYYDLQLMRAIRGEASFNKEKQNAPLAEGASTFSIASLRRFRREGDTLVLEPAKDATGAAQAPRLELDSLAFYGFLDPALGESSAGGSRRAGDFAAIATVGIDRHGYVYVVDVWMERVPPSKQIEKILELHDHWSYTGFGIETNAFQKLMLEPLKQAQRDRSARGEDWAFPVRSVNQSNSKRMRILSMEPHIASGWIAFWNELSEEFLTQLEQFPGGMHDDGPDAVQAAIALARSAFGGVSKKVEHSPPKAKRHGAY